MVVRFLLWCASMAAKYLGFERPWHTIPVARQAAASWGVAMRVMLLPGCCTGAVSGGRPNAAAELQQAAEAAVMRVLGAFGEAAASRFLVTAPGDPAFGSAADAASDLRRCLQRLIDQQQRVREQQQQQQQQAQQQQAQAQQQLQQ
jgi:hypothetical protein